MKEFSLKSGTILYAAAFVIIMIVYGQTINFSYGLDDQLINEQIPGRSDGLNGILHIFQQRYGLVDYRPFVILSYAAEKWIGGEMNPFISHLVNLFLYFLIIIGVYKTITNYIQDDKYKPIILLSLIIFIVHPVHVEVVANLKSRDNLLSFLFTISSVCFFLRYFFQKKGILNLLIAFLFFIIAIFSKLDAAGLLFFLPLMLFTTKKIKLKTAVLFTIVFYIIFNAVRFNLIDTLMPLENSTATSGVTFTENPISADFKFTNRIAAAALTFWYYIKMMMLPFGYRYYYGYDAVKLYAPDSWQSITAIAGIAGLLSIILKFYLRDRFILICCSGFVCYILYALNFITPVAGIIADRFIFISSLFICGCISYLLFTYIRKKNVLYATIGIIIFTLTAISFYRTTAWKDKLTLIERDAPHLRNSYEAMRIATATYIEYADKESVILEKERLLKGAVNCAEYGNAVYPDNVLLQKLHATAYFKLNNYDAAKKIFHIAIKNNHLDYESYTFLGDIFYLERNLDSAYYYYQTSFLHNKKDPVLIGNISSILYEKGDKNGCIRFNEQLISENDSLYAAWENLGYFYLLEKDTAKAINYFENGFRYGLQNPEIGQLVSAYLNKKNQPERAKFFQNHTQ